MFVYLHALQRELNTSNLRQILQLSLACWRLAASQVVGLPATLMSNNGKTFRGSSKEIVKIARSKEVLRYLAINGVSWSFIVEKAPWWGRLLGEINPESQAMSEKSLGRTTLSYDELNTLLVEIESVVKSRPLTYVEEDQDGVSYTLSPLHLINGRRITNKYSERQSF